MIKLYVNLLMLHLFAAPVVPQSRFNAEWTLGNHAMAIQKQVKICSVFQIDLLILGWLFQKS